MMDITIQQQLVRAIASGNCDRVRELLAMGVDVNHPAQGTNGETPLIRAIATGQLEIIQILAQAGADVNLPQQGASGWTPLMYAFDKPAITQNLIATGADVNACIPIQRDAPSKPGGNTMLATALHFAAAANNLEVVRILIQAGAKIEARTVSGLAPLDLAIRFGNMTAVAEALLEAGAQLTPQRVEAMHASTHSPDSDLLFFPWSDQSGAGAGNTLEVLPTRRDQSTGPATLSEGESEPDECKCPKCGALMYSRKAKMCGRCGAVTPVELLLTEEQVQATEAERQWARDLAESFTLKNASARLIGQRGAVGSSREESESVASSPSRLLGQTDFTAEFSNRPRPHFGLYLVGYYIFLLVMFAGSQAVGGFSWRVWLPIAGVITLLCFRAWQCTNPVCPNCHQNIRTCAAVYCLSCGEPLRGRRCEQCAVDHSWKGLLSPSNNLNFRWISCCPSCGSLLKTKVQRWGAWGRI